MEELRERSKPKHVGKSKVKRSGTSKHKKITDEQRQQAYQKVVGEIVFDQVVLFVPNTQSKDAVAGQTPPMWRVEKPITGDKFLDGNAHKGARTVYDEHGRKVSEFDSDGKKIWSRA